MLGRRMAPATTPQESQKPLSGLELPSAVRTHFHVRTEGDLHGSRAGPLSVRKEEDEALDSPAVHGVSRGSVAFADVSYA